MRGHIALYVPNRTEMKIYFQPLTVAPNAAAPLFSAQSPMGVKVKGVFKGSDDILLFVEN